MALSIGFLVVQKVRNRNIQCFSQFSDVAFTRDCSELFVGIERAFRDTCHLSKLRLMDASLRRDFGIIRPRIAVLGLNPHSGDGGMLGREEIEIINPAIEAAGQENILAFGAYSPDGFFSTHQQYNFDAVLAMYHDQGLIPFKALAFDTGVNFTAGLPVVRTAPDHGTAYELAGKGTANPMPMKSAIYEAIDIVRNRWNYDQMRENVLKSAPAQEGGSKSGVRGPV